MVVASRSFTLFSYASVKDLLCSSESISNQYEFQIGIRFVREWQNTEKHIKLQYKLVANVIPY